MGIMHAVLTFGTCFKSANFKIKFILMSLAMQLIYVVTFYWYYSASKKKSVFSYAQVGKTRFSLKPHPSKNFVKEPGTEGLEM